MPQALHQSLILSGAFAAAETLVAAALVFTAHVPLFLYGCAALLRQQAYGVRALQLQETDLLVAAIHQLPRDRAGLTCPRPD